MKNTLFTLTLLLAGSLLANAQQVQVNNQYLVNKSTLSPAYAGIKGNFEAYMTYRRNWVGFDGAPEIKKINLNNAIGKNMGLGLSFSSQKAGIFRGVFASIDYAWHLRFSGEHRLSFGLAAGFYENYIDILVNKPQSDPVVLSNQQVNQTVPDATFGVLYRFKKFHAGISIPQLLEDKIKNDVAGNNIVYTLKRHLLTNVSYDFSFGKNMHLEPFAIIRKSLGNSPLLYEFAGMLKYRDKGWIGMNYRKRGAMGISVGGMIYDKVLMSYTYEFASSGILGSSSGNHELTLGLQMSKTSRTQTKKPYYEWLDK